MAKTMKSGNLVAFVVAFVVGYVLVTLVNVRVREGLEVVTWTGTFNPTTYLAANPDIAAGVARGVTTAEGHWNTHGKGENRQGSGMTRVVTVTPAPAAAATATAAARPATAPATAPAAAPAPMAASGPTVSMTAAAPVPPVAPVAPAADTVVPEKKGGIVELLSTKWDSLQTRWDEERTKTSNLYLAVILLGVLVGLFVLFIIYRYAMKFVPAAAPPSTPYGTARRR